MISWKGALAPTLLLLSLPTLPQPADADDLKSGMATCAVIAGDLDRLGCYDKMAAAAGLAGPQPEPVTPPPEGTGKWQVDRDKNPIDDSERVVISLQADSGASQFKGPVTFTARCQSKKTEAFIVWGDYLGNDGDIEDSYKDVTTRIGNKPAVTQRWTISTDSEATFAPGSNSALLKTMSASDKLIAETTPYDASPVTAIFDTTGMAASLKPLADACGWSIAADKPAAAGGKSAPTPLAGTSGGL